ncbi:Creatinase/aminopeptidase [Hesseltinella vesiculosa]|uniref:Creatinase/aminopeptidase n=1 Tax=Hesseltinella vesiculosa TaxID=101127 RepID=A0A1X2GII1_9FUNG|nr:Creatinase/aminopeptidase [Hesseltinella vesiculosa]
MSAMELTTSYPPTKFETDNDFKVEAVLVKYKNSALIVNSVLPQVLARIAAGVSICDLCQYGDDLLEALSLSQFKTAERGISMPTCVTVNQYVQYMSPLNDENDYHLKVGDVVKVELGVHIDGYIASAAHTVVVPLNPQQPMSGPAADVICATYYAHEAVLRMLQPGVKASQITSLITEIAAYYRCTPVENTYSSVIKRFVLRAGQDIENGFPEDMLVEDLEKHDFEIQANQAYQINILLTSGNGKTKTSEFKPFVYQRDVNKSHQLKIKAARAAYNVINQKHTVFPFSTRALPNSQIRLGLASLLQHELITSHPVFRSASNKDLVAQFKSTILMSATGILRLTLPQPLSFVHSEYCIPQNTVAHQALSAPNAIQTVKEPANIAQSDIVFGARRVETEDADMELE